MAQETQGCWYPQLEDSSHPAATQSSYRAEKLHVPCVHHTEKIIIRGAWQLWPPVPTQLYQRTPFLLRHTLALQACQPPISTLFAESSMSLLPHVSEWFSTDYKTARIDWPRPLSSPVSYHHTLHQPCLILGSKQNWKRFLPFLGLEQPSSAFRSNCLSPCKSQFKCALLHNSFVPLDTHSTWLWLLVFMGLSARFMVCLQRGMDSNAPK